MHSICKVPYQLQQSYVGIILIALLFDSSDKPLTKSQMWRLSAVAEVETMSEEKSGGNFYLRCQIWESVFSYYLVSTQQPSSLNAFVSLKS